MCQDAKDLAPNEVGLWSIHDIALPSLAVNTFILEYLNVVPNPAHHHCTQSLASGLLTCSEHMPLLTARQVGTPHPSEGPYLEPGSTP